LHYAGGAQQGGDSVDYFQDFKLRCVLIAWPVVLIVAALAAIHLVVGWKSAAKYIRELTLIWPMAWCAALALGALAYGFVYIEPHHVYPEVFGWSIWERLGVMLHHLFWALVFVGVATAVFLGWDFLLRREKGLAGRWVFWFGTSYGFYLLSGIVYIFIAGVSQ
jgi:hypothetical protein